jgi:Ser/Thr protein kinase RdoA (MazF antagonist)
MKYTETDIAKQSLSLFGIVGSLRRVATKLDSIYRVKADDGRVFALRVSSGMPIRRVSAFRVEAEWIDALAGNGWFDVPQVQRTEDGERIGQVRDADGVWRASTLLAWLPGRRFKQFTARRARSLGQMAGALHQHAQAFGTPPAEAIKPWDARLMCFIPNTPQSALQRIAPETAEQVQKVYRELEGIVATLSVPDLGLINADLGLHNVIWHQGQAGLVDFNDAGIGPYAFCLARLVGRVRGEEKGQAMVDELLKGYREVIPLPAAYERWGGLFELAADAFRLNYGAGRAAHRGIPFRPFEQALAGTLARKLKQIGL